MPHRSPEDFATDLRDFSNNQLEGAAKIADTFTTDLAREQYGENAVIVARTIAEFIRRLKFTNASR